VPTQSRQRESLRNALIEAAARLIATEGASALTLRRVADEVGTSTMAIYTAFGGMPELRRSVRHEGFARLTEKLEGVTQTEDPVADLFLLGGAYYVSAVANPHLYRVTFMEQPLDADDAELGSEAHRVLLESIQRCLDAGRFKSADPHALATEFWALGHGVIALELAQLISSEEARDCLEGACSKLFRGYGDEQQAIERSLKSARQRRSEV